MPKKFKTKIYKKDLEDHFVVAINPWANGERKPRGKSDIDWIGAWLRIAFRKSEESDIIRTIFTLDTRDEVIVQLNPCVDVKVGLGAHLWGSFLKHEELDRIARRHNMILHDRISYIFPYDWAKNGNPGEHQWRDRYPAHDPIHDNIAVKRPYPDPVWSATPRADTRLLKLLLPLPREITPTPSPSPAPPPLLPYSPSHRPDSDLNGPQQVTTSPIEPCDNNSWAAAQASETDVGLTPYQPHMRFTQASNQPSDRLDYEDIKSGDNKGFAKINKADLYDESEAAQDLLANTSVKKERKPIDVWKSDPTKVKGEPEESKPNVHNEKEYRPSESLVKAISQLHNNSLIEAEEHKPIVKEEYQPSQVLTDIISRYSSHSDPSENKPRMNYPSQKAGHSSRAPDVHPGGSKRNLSSHDYSGDIGSSSGQAPKRVKREGRTA
ncbi:hypothetical protein M0805_004902 [Coniferiporia weirii]|nr:hypothetical protein M0805_004902 [Coniferiporia weirii]